MAKKRKKTRKELLKEPDEFLTISAKLIGLAREYQTQLAWALGVILVLAVVFSGFRLYLIRSESNASALLGSSVDKYRQAKSSADPQAAFQQVSADFELLLNKYGSRQSAKLGRLIYANICYDAGKYKQAIGLYRAALGDFQDWPMISGQIIASLGYACEQLQDTAGAVSYFEKLSVAPEAHMQDEALYHLGRLYEQQGQSEKSKQMFAKILAEHPDFIYIDLVKERMSG
jgi:tetratricopeptide (TPR) repeat protein